MSTLAASGVLLALVAVLLGAGMWIFAGLTLVGAGALFIVLDFSILRIGTIATKVISSSAISWNLRQFRSSYGWETSFSALTSR